MKWASTISSGGGGDSAIWHLHWLGLTPRLRRVCGVQGAVPPLHAREPNAVQASIHRVRTRTAEKRRRPSSAIVRPALEPPEDGMALAASSRGGSVGMTDDGDAYPQGPRGFLVQRG